MPRINQVDNAGGGPQEWFQSLPIVTQYWFGASLLLTLAGNLGIISPLNFVFKWEHITERFELWRFLTCFCYVGPFEFPTLINLYLMVSFSKQYETGGPFNTGAGGGTADYAFMWLLGAVSCIVLKPVFSLIGVGTGSIFSRNMIFYVLYVWSKNNPTANVNIWGVPLKAIYLPFAYVILSVFMGAPYMYMIHGILLGHLYYFLVDVFPNAYGKDVLQTPQFLIDQLGIGHFVPAGQPTAPMEGDTNATANRAHSWGATGQRLGGPSTAANSSSAPRSTSSSASSSTTNRRPAAAQSNRGGPGHNWGGTGQRLGSD